MDFVSNKLNDVTVDLQINVGAGILSCWICYIGKARGQDKEESGGDPLIV